MHRCLCNAEGSTGGEERQRLTTQPGEEVRSVDSAQAQPGAPVDDHPPQDLGNSHPGGLQCRHCRLFPVDSPLEIGLPPQLQDGGVVVEIDIGLTPPSEELEPGNAGPALLSHIATVRRRGAGARESRGGRDYGRRRTFTAPSAFFWKIS